MISLPLKPSKKADGEVNGDGRGTPVPMEAPATSVASGKRKRDAEEEVESAKKRAKAGKAVREVLEVDDDGAILLDD